MIRAYASTVIAVPAQDLWARVRDFNGLPQWHPAATDSHIEEGHANGTLGCVRNFALSDGSGRIRETLLAISDVDRSLTYNMLPGGPLPFVDYVSTIKLTPVTDTNQTFAAWTADFKAADGEDEKWKAFVANDVFLGGLRALEASFA